MQKYRQSIASTQLQSHNEYVKTLDRLESHLQTKDFEILISEFVEEKISFFKECSEKLLIKLFKIAHAVVAAQLTCAASFVTAFPDIATIHPVYGALIHTFFQGIGSLSPRMEFIFFQDAGDNYYKNKHWIVAISFYRRAYEHARLSNIDNILLVVLKEKLNKLEILIYTGFFLELENTHSTELSLEVLERKIARFLTIADQLCQEKLNDALQACYQTPLLTRYLEMLGTSLQRLVVEKDGLARLEQIINEKILPLAERISLHVMVDKNLQVFLSHCYKLVYNVIRDHGLKLLLLQQRLTAHENTLYEKRKKSSSLLTSLENKLVPLWLELASNPIKPLEGRLLNSLTGNVFLEHLTSHTINIITIAKQFCERLQLILGMPPCPYELLYLGSSTRNEMLNTSDLDIAIVINPGHIASAALLTLRRHPYFKHLLQALNHLLQLCNGKWYCTNIMLQRNETVPTYLQQEITYHIKAVGLRIDAMDINEMEVIINTPQELAKWVATHCVQLDQNLNIKHRIIAYSLLTPISLYHSDKFEPSLLSLYLTELREQLNQMRSSSKSKSNSTNVELPNAENHFSYFIESTKDEYIRLIKQWQQRNSWRLDQIYYFIKDSLWILDAWSLIMVSATTEDYAHSLFSNSNERLLFLEKTKKVTTYFIEGVRQGRILLLKFKYLLENEPDYKKCIDWQQWELYWVHIVLPAAYQIAHIRHFTQDNINDPYREFLYNFDNSKILNNNDKNISIFSSLLFTSQSIAWLKQHQANVEDFKNIYYVFLNKHDYNQYCANFVEQLIVCFGFSAELTQILIQIPDEVGYRQSERLAYAQLDQDIMAITMAEKDTSPSTEIILAWPNAQNEICERQLRPELMAALIEMETGQLKRQYTNSRHAVAALDYKGHCLHIKAYPDQPMMDYAVDIFQRRLFGRGTPANTLARLIVKTKSKLEITYPILISQTRGKLNLREELKTNPALKINPVRYTEMVITALLTGPGDAASRNFILVEAQENKTGEYDFEAAECIDNEQQFVEHIIKETTLSGFNKVQFQHVFFNLSQADAPLELAKLKEVAEKQNIYGLLNHWIRTIQRREQVYLKLYDSLTERQTLYNRSKDDRFTPRCLLREGVLGEIFINLSYLQNIITLALADNKPPSALDLQQQINFRLGHYYREAFQRYSDPEKRFQAATGAPQASVSSSLAIKASLGLVPTFEQTEAENKYSLTEAKKELLCLLDFKPDFSKLIDAQGKPDINRQTVMLKSIALYPHKQLCLSHCVVLTDDILELLLKKSTQLMELDLRNCLQLTEKAVRYLAKNHTGLKKLYLSNNKGISRISDDSIITKNHLQFPQLEILHISHCENLVTIRIKAPRLAEFKDLGCIKLREKQVIAIDSKASPLLEYSLLTQQRKLPSQPQLNLQNLAKNKINVIIWFDQSAETYSRDIPQNYQEQDYTVTTSLYYGSKKEIPKLYGNKDIILLVGDAQNKASAENIEIIANLIYQQVQQPIPLLLVSISNSQFNENIIFTYQYSVGRNETPTDVIRAVVAGLPTAAILLYEAITYQLQSKKLEWGAKTVKMPKQIQLEASGIPIIKTVAASLENEKADHTNRYFNKTYRLMHTVIGVDLYMEKIIDNNQTFIIQLWDTSAQERFLAVSRQYYKNTCCVCIFVSLNDHHLFTRTIKFYKEGLSQYADKEVPFVLIGMEADSSRRTLAYDEAKAIAKEHGMDAYFECSAKSGLGIEEAFKGTFEIAIAKNNFWEWLGRSYTPSPHVAKAMLGNLFPSLPQATETNPTSLVSQRP